MFNFSFSGRAQRSEYWRVYLSWIALTLVIFFVAIATTIGSVDCLRNGADSFVGLLGAWFFILILDAIVGAVVILALTVRRCNDIGINPFWSLATFLPYIGFGAVLIFGVLDSDNQSVVDKNIKSKADAVSANNEINSLTNSNLNGANHLFEGERTIHNDSYKLFISQKYNIQKNDLFKKFVCNEKLFETIDEAIAFAIELEDQLLKEKEQAEERLRKQQIEADIAAEKKRNELSEQARKEEIEAKEKWLADAPTRAKRKKIYAFSFLSLLIVLIIFAFSFRKIFPPEFAITPQYDSASNFSEGLAAVDLGNINAPKFGYINKKGEIIIEPQFNQAAEFKDGVSVACIKVSKQVSKCGLINKEGKFVVNPQFDSIGEFSEGLAAVSIGEREKSRWGFINKEGKLIIEMQFIDAVPFCEYGCSLQFKDGLAAIKMPGDDGKFGFIDKLGKFVISPKFERVSDFSEGLAPAMLDGKAGYINKSGEFVISPKFGAAYQFYEGLATIYENYNYGFINKAGKVVIQPQFQWVTDFNDGVALAGVGQGGESKYGFINKKGEFLINPQFDSPDHVGSYLGFKEELAPVKIGNKWGYMDKAGKITVKPSYDSAGQFSEGLAPVKIGNKWGYISK